MTTANTPPQYPGAWLGHLGGRKYTVVILVILVASAGLFLGRVDGSQWLGAVTVAVGLYNLANAATRWSARPTNTEPPAPAIEHNTPEHG